jgi:hypothetical protein
MRDRADVGHHHVPEGLAAESKLETGGGLRTRIAELGHPTLRWLDRRVPT